LRRGSEEYFTQVCTALQAPVKYKPTRQHDLGDLLNGGVSAYKKILKQAKYSARHWEKFEELAKLEEIDEYSKDVLKRTNMERWAVNPAVHFNHWSEFTPEDFRPVVHAFQDLYFLFKCEHCGTFLHLTLKDNQQESVKCDCNRINWNLKGK
jgi:hypothetical protein